MDYLSTVSGGGYIGSWLSAWRSRAGQSIATVEESLVSEPEPKELTYLRDFTSFLTPRRGLMSSDTWAGIATLVRNLVLNWTLFLPLLLLLVWIPKFTVLVFDWGQNWLDSGGGGAPLEPGSPACRLSGWAAALLAWIPKVTVLVFEWGQNWLFPGDGSAQLVRGSPAFCLLATATALYLISELFTSWQVVIQEQQGGPVRRPDPYGAGQGRYVLLGVLPAYAAACLASIVLIRTPEARDGWALVNQFAIQFAKVGALLWGLSFQLALVGALLWALLKALLCALFKAPRGSPFNIACWWRSWWRFFWLVVARFLSGAGFGVALVLAVALLRHLASQYDDRYVVVFGISGFFLAHVAGSVVFAGLSGPISHLDTVREWTARAGGWFLVSGLVWTVYASLVLWDPNYDWPATLLPEGWPGKLVHLLMASGGIIAAVVAALFGRSRSTPATEGQKSSRTGINWDRVAVAGALFFFAVVVFELSWAFDWAVLPDSLANLTKCHALASSIYDIGIRPRNARTASRN